MTKGFTRIFLAVIISCSCFFTNAGCDKHSENETSVLTSSYSITETISSKGEITRPDIVTAITEETAINDGNEKSLIYNDNISCVRFSDGTFSNSTEYASNLIKPQYNHIRVGDKLGNMTVEKIISTSDNVTHALTQSQVCFSGEATLSGWLYYGKNEVLSFGNVKLDENVLYFIPKLTDESKFPLSLQAVEYFTVFDEKNSFYLTADSEPIMLGIGADTANLVENITFSSAGYAFATVVFKDFQIRYGLDWFTLKYENCAVPVKIISETSMDSMSETTANLLTS